METIIYGLKIKGSRDDFFYVGRTKDLRGRMNGHNWAGDGTHINHFVLFLKSMGIDFEYEILDVVPDEYAHYAEVAKINIFATRGCILMNKRYNPYTLHLNYFS